MRSLAKVLFVAVSIGLLAGPVSAQAYVSLDENGQGSAHLFNGAVPIPSFVGQDTGPTGLPNALLYIAGPVLGPWVTGDLILSEPSTDDLLSDLLRFNPDGTIAFYSDNADGVDALADVGFPPQIYENFFTVAEQGPEGNNSATYTPSAGQPGFLAGNPGLTWVIISDQPTVPEPSTMTLLGGGVLGLLGYVHRKRMK